MKDKQTFVIIYGKNGAGKTTVADKYGYRRVISRTTRPPREGEVDGIDYHFETVEKYRNYKTTLAPEKFVDHYYYCLPSDVRQKDAYIVGPEGVKFFMSIKDIDMNQKIVIVKIESPLYKRIYRMYKRGDKVKDIIKRILREPVQYRGLKPDIVILNK